MAAVENRKKAGSSPSLDFMLVIALELLLVAILIMSGKLSLERQAVLAASGLTLVVSISVARRIRRRWHWPGITRRDMFKALIVAAGGLLFLASLYPRYSPFTSRGFAWFSIAAIIFIYGMLESLRIIPDSEDFFKLCCGDKASAKQALLQYAGKKNNNLKHPVFYSFFAVVWILTMIYFWKAESAFSTGAPQPTLEKTASMSDHGRTVYITPEDRRTIRLLSIPFFLGIPLVLIISIYIRVIDKNRARINKHGGDTLDVGRQNNASSEK